MSDNFQSSVGDKNFFQKNIKIISIVAVVIVLIAGIVSIIVYANKAKTSAYGSNDTYEIFKPYYSLTSDSSQDSIKSALSTIENANFSSNADESRANFYMARLYSRLNDKENERGCLKKAMDLTSSDDYIYLISVYNLAVLEEEAGNNSTAVDYYKTLLSIKDDPIGLREKSAFAGYRLTKDSADGSDRDYFLAVLNNEFPSGAYLNFINNIANKQ